MWDVSGVTGLTEGGIGMLGFGHPNVESLAAKRDVKGLIRALGSSRFGVSAQAEKALTAIGAPAVDALSSALGDSNPELRRKTAWILRWIGDPRAVDPLIDALGDKNEAVRKEAAGALGGFGDPRAVGPLIGALGDKDRAVREEAADALGRCGDSRAVDSLIGALDDTDTGVRTAAAHALGGLGDAHAIPPLIARLDDGNESLRLSVARSLAELGDLHAADPLLSDFENDKYYFRRRQAAEGLGHLGDPRAVPSLIEALGHFSSAFAMSSSVADLDEYQAMRSCVARALAEIGDRRAVRPLLESLDDTGSGVRIEVIAALAAIGDIEALAPLIHVLRSDQVADVRAHAALALPAFGAAGVADSLRKARDDDPKSAVRDAAKNSLAALGGVS